MPTEADYKTLDHSFNGSPCTYIIIGGVADLFTMDYCFNGTPFVINIDSAPTTGNIKSFSGIARANIKTINKIAFANIKSVNGIID
jgi:hypothetical protein